MAERESELRTVAWGEVFPFLRLFRTFRLAIRPTRLLMALAAVALVCLAGWVMDRIWVGAGHGALVQAETRQSEVQAYAALGSSEFAQWKEHATEAREAALRTAAVRLGMVKPDAQSATLPSGRALLNSAQADEQVSQALREVDRLRDSGLDRVKGDKELSKADRQQQVAAVNRAADYLVFLLTGNEPAAYAIQGEPGAAVDELLRANPGVEPEHQAALRQATMTGVALDKVRQSQPAGDFASLLSYEMRCFAGAVRGVVTFHWGFSTPAWDRQPSFLGSIVSAGSGVQWLVTQHPVFFIIYAIAYFAIFAFFGGAICRSAAVEAARDEVISPMDALRYARQKFGGLALAPGLPAGIFAGVLVVFVVCSILGVIPWLGELLTGILFGLALLGGFALAMILIGTVLGLHLTWPTIAAEGSDGFDAVSHAFAYVSQRPWYAAFYSWVLLLYGAVCFVVVRLIALTTLKLTHVCSDWGMSFFGAAGSARTDAVSKLDAMWHMPAWSDLSFLPAASGHGFWGAMYAAPLNWSESIAAALIAIWVFLVVGLVGAFAVSFFFCGSTQMYFLLRRNVDAVDYDEIYYEEAEPELPVAATAGEPTTTGEAEAPAPGAVPAAVPESGGSA
jgi:hypothetical protein